MAPSLAVTIASRLLLPKADSSQADCEDSISIDLPHLRFAVADGATEGFDSRRWARYLTRAWIAPSSRTPANYEFIEQVRPLAERLESKWLGRQLPWYLEEKAASGSFAAFLGLQLTATWTWSAVALGDVCLVIERTDAVQESFPLSAAEQFSNRPFLLGSKTGGEATKQALRLGQGVCLPGDVLLLMSDAVACWYLGHAASNRDLQEEFHDALVDRGTSLEFISRERASGRLRNDDVAVVKLVLSSIENGD